MISVKDGLFCLYTRSTCCLIRKTAYGHAELVHYGARVRPEDAAALSLKRTASYGTAVNYAEGNDTYCLDTLPLAWAGAGRGDYRESPIELETENGGATDFRITACSIVEGSVPAEGMPCAEGGDETMILTLKDKTAGAELTLYFTVFERTDVITRRAVLKNTGASPMTVHRLMSGMLDLPGTYELTSFHGGWISEAHREKAPVGGARAVIESVTGMSSNRDNPGFLLSEPEAGQAHGRVYGFNLVWSGNHYASAQRSKQGLTRVMQGFSPRNFQKTLLPGDILETPEAVMSFSDEGFNGLSARMHDFVNRHIVPAHWRNRERPIIYNSWEGCGFSFSERRLLELAKKAAKLGCELFVLDDGWFGARDSDTAGLGDYGVNLKKLPGGLSGLREKLSRVGLDFGLWVEPEAVNPDSDLYRAHPDWALTEPGRDPVYGRNELLLDLTREDVRDYIVESVGHTLDVAGVSYVKWDMNRHSTALGAKAYDYTLGLYDVLRRIFGPRPEILLESCASGGNRFDLGMLRFGAQIWASDDTDPVERLDIQDGLSYLYPLSSMGAHVSASPHQQTLRTTSLSTRGNVSFFGLLGYELDLKYLSSVDEKDIREQIAFYKKYRSIFQFGRFTRLPAPQSETRWQVSDGDTAIAGVFWRLFHAAPAFDELRMTGLDPDLRYTIQSREQNLRVGDFGELVRYVAPMRFNPKGLIMNTADRYYVMADCAERMEATGAALMSGVRLANRFNGTGYNANIRLQTDFGSVVYLVQRDMSGTLPAHKGYTVLDERHETPAEPSADGETPEDEPEHTTEEMAGRE